MAARIRRKTFRRRFRRKWDMQTFRLCEQQLDFKEGFAETCNSPNVDFVKIVQPALSELQGASRALMFGGGHLRIRYNVAILDHDHCPCTHNEHIVTAIVKLPLLEDDITPAYLPNLAVTRTFDSIVLSSNADNDEDILWWRSDQVDVLNLACVAGPNGDIPCENSGSNCGGGSETLEQDKFVLTLTHAAALYGRVEINETIRVRRKLREREALFLTTQTFGNAPGDWGNCPGWPFRRNAYLRYAIRPTR